MYQAREINRISPLSRKPMPTTWQVEDESGLYATLHSREDAALVAYGLNHGYPQHFLGGFSDVVAAEIRAAMAAGTLRPGQRYDVASLCHAGWTGPAEGYAVEYYFDEDGTYLGPDRDGVEPTFHAS